MVTASNNLFKTRSGFQECRWLALNNPNYLKLVRQDYAVTVINTSGLFTNVTVNTTGISQAQFESDFVVGSQMYISAIDKVKTISQRTYIGNNSIVRFAFDGINYSTGGGYVNCFSRQDYFIELKYRIVGTVEAKTEKIIPFTNGELDVNISPALVRFLTLKTDGEDLSLINIRDTNASNVFFINYREYYGGDFKGELPLITRFQGVNNYKYALEQYGSCLVEYEMQVLSLHKFLTRMQKPYYWAGYPFALGFLYSDYINSILLQKLELERDINDQAISSAAYNLEPFNPNQNYEYMNSLTLEGGYTGDSVVVQLISGATSGGIFSGYSGGYAAGYFLEKIFGAQAGIQGISEQKRVFIGKCADSPAYLRWRNSLGYFDHWLFTRKQVKNINVDKFDTFNPLVTDIEFQQESETVQSKDKNKVWRLGAYLEMQSVTDINELFSSPFVQWYNEENQQWYSVKVRQGTYLEQITNESYSEVEFDIEFPNEYKQEQ